MAVRAPGRGSRTAGSGCRSRSSAASRPRGGARSSSTAPTAARRSGRPPRAAPRRRRGRGTRRPRCCRRRRGCPAGDLAPRVDAIGEAARSGSGSRFRARDATGGGRSCRRGTRRARGRRIASPWATPGSHRRRGSGFAWRGKIAARQAASRSAWTRHRDRHTGERHHERHQRHVAPRAGQQQPAEHRDAEQSRAIGSDLPAPPQRQQHEPGERRGRAPRTGSTCRQRRAARRRPIRATCATSSRRSSRRSRTAGA